jgi:hypothetical protein
MATVRANARENLPAEGVPQRIGCSGRSDGPPFPLADPVNPALANCREDAVGDVVHRYALDGHHEDLVRLSDLDAYRGCPASSGLRGIQMLAAWPPVPPTSETDPPSRSISCGCYAS